MATVGVIRGAINTALGTQEFRDPNLNNTPTAAIFFATFATADGVATTHALQMIGFTDGTSEVVNLSTAEDGVNPSDNRRVASTTKCVRLDSPVDGSLIGEADFSAWLPDAGAGAGVEIDWTTASGVAYLLTVVLFSATNASAGIFNPNAVQDASVNVTPNFESDLIFLYQNGTSMPVDTTSFSASFGVAQRATLNNRCWALRATNGLSPTQNGFQISELYGCINVTVTGLVDYAIEITAVGATTFTATTRGGAGNASHEIAYLAIKMEKETYVDSIDFDNAIGNQSFVGPAFEPQFCLIGISNAESYDTDLRNNEAGSLGVGVFTGNTEISNVVSLEDNVATTNTQSLSDNVSVNKPDDDGVADSVSSFVSMDTLGWTWDITAAPTNVKKFFSVAIETDAVSGTGNTFDEHPWTVPTLWTVPYWRHRS